MNVASPDFPNLTGGTWIEEGDVAAKDPLMAIAFRTSEAVFVGDIETAGAEVVNLTYEQEGFGHRALIHAPIYYEGHCLGHLWWGASRPTINVPVLTALAVAILQIASNIAG